MLSCSYTALHQCVTGECPSEHLSSSNEGNAAAQVTPHFRLRNAAGETTRATECFECAPKPTRNKTYPVCTIRNTPDKPIHCIVWAKELLFARLFGRWGTLLHVLAGSSFGL